MSFQVALRVRLKVPDTTALSAEDILRRKMGYRDQLGGLDRQDWWLFEVDVASRDRALECVGGWARRSTSLVNPNKHRVAMEVVQVWPPRRPGGQIQILVRNREDVTARSMARFLRETLNASELRSLKSGTLWTLRAGPAVADARSLAEEVAVTVSRTRGLLANPHSQVVEVWEGGWTSR